jgi:hypothetical protein
MPQIFFTEEYANMVFILGVCDAKATAASLRIAGCTLTAGFRILKQFKGHSTHYGKQVRFHSEGDPEGQSVEEENILTAVQHSPHASTRRLA